MSKNEPEIQGQKRPKAIRTGSVKRSHIELLFVQINTEVKVYTHNNKINTVPDSFVEATKKATLLCFRRRENLARIFGVI
jgi:hypothetical protein